MLMEYRVRGRTAREAEVVTNSSLTNLNIVFIVSRRIRTLQAV